MYDPAFDRIWVARAERTDIRRIVSEARAFLSPLLPESALRKLLTVAEELLANALEHGCFALGRSAKERLLASDSLESFLSAAEKTHSSKNITLALSFTDTRLTLAVTDPGAGFDYAKYADSKPGTETVGGRGLFLARSLSDELEFKEGGTRAEASFVI